MEPHEAFLATLLQKFGHLNPHLGSPPDPTATFPATHMDVGNAKVWSPVVHSSNIGEVTTVDLAVGEILVDHFTSYDSNVSTAERAERLTCDVVRFLDQLFADRLLFWISNDSAGRRGWRERGDAGHTEPLVLDDRTYSTYVWSGPLGIWRATPSIVARGRVRDDRECQVLLNRLDDESVDRLAGAERELVERLVREYERETTD
jgi:hypothetical protein